MSMDPRRPQQTLQDFFLYLSRKEAEQQINNLFRKLIRTLIVLNVLLGVPTIYDKFFYDHTPNIQRDTSTIQMNEV